jgi:hypothetical protein
MLSLPEGDLPLFTFCLQYCLLNLFETWFGTLKTERMESHIILSFWNNKTKGPKQDSQNRLRSPMPEGGEPFDINYFISIKKKLYPKS